MEDVLSHKGTLRPFLKWAGNKFSIVERIRKLLPEGKRLVEPFAGSAAVFLNTDYPSALLTDSNADLIQLYLLVQREGERFIHEALQLFVPRHNKAEVFYRLREEFNNTQDARRKALLFLYLNRYGYNGLCRYNAKGKFNVPFGRYGKPYFPAKEMLAFHQRAKQVTFKVASFRQTMQEAKRGDVVYCDPPYVPLSRTANFTSYHVGGFGEKEQQELAELAEDLSRRGIPVVISNHDTEFTHKAYGNAKLERFSVRRLISSNAGNRGKAAELLALFSAA